MNTAVILAGGVGTRMGGSRPKQYLTLGGQPVILYALRAVQRHADIHHIVIVAAEEWRQFIDRLLEQNGIGKFCGYGEPGQTRQLSILHGLETIRRTAPDTTGVLIHDAARPALTSALITACLAGLGEADGAMPVLPMKDTCYVSEDGRTVEEFIPRRKLFAGQAPEAFRYDRYLAAHYRMSREELLEISGSSEMAYKSGLSIVMVPGDERNIKITTQEDLALVERYLTVE